MKKLALLAALAIGGVAAYGQGVINGFNAFSVTPGGPLSYVRDYATGEGSPLAKAVGRVEVLTADGLTVLSPVQDGTGNALAADGIFSLGPMTVPGSTVGSPATVLLRAWDNSTGGTYALATEKASIEVTFATIGSATAPSNFVLGSGFPGLQLQLIPEPSTVALAALGVAGLFFVARRKR